MVGALHRGLGRKELPSNRFDQKFWKHKERLALWAMRLHHRALTTRTTFAASTRRAHVGFPFTGPGVIPGNPTATSRKWTIAFRP